MEDNKVKLNREQLEQIIREEIKFVRLEGLIKEITRRKFCQLMGMAGLATGCGQDYELLHVLATNQAGVPAPECINDIQIVPPLSDGDAWTSQPIKLYDFIAQPAFGRESVNLEDDGDELTLVITNVPITADIWKSVQVTASRTPQFDEDDLTRIYTEPDEVLHLVTVKIKFPIYTGEDGEEYIKHTTDGGYWATIPQRRGNCLQSYKDWLSPGEENLEEIIKEELLVVLKEAKYHWNEPGWHYDGGYGDPEGPYAKWYLKKEEQVKEDQECFDNKTFKGKSKCISREKGISKKSADAYTATVMRKKGKIKEADPKKGTGKKPKGSGRRLYTDEDPSDTVSVKFSSVSAIQKTLAKPSFKSKSHKRQSQIINLIHQRARAAYKNAKDPKVKARLKKAYEYAKKRKEASKRKTIRLRKKKKK